MTDQITFYRNLTIFLLSACVLYSCTKETQEVPESTSISKVERLASNNWELTSHTTDNIFLIDSCAVFLGESYELFPACYDECRWDDFIDFDINDSSSYSINNGAVTCLEDSLNSVLEQGTWLMNLTETELFLISDNNTVMQYEIVSLSALELILRRTEIFNGQLVFHEYRYD